MKNNWLLFFMILPLFAEAQISPVISVKNTTLISTDSILPFWFTANQSGKIRNAGSLLNLSDLSVEQKYKNNNLPLSYTFGLHIVAAFAETNYFQLNQAYGGIVFKGWELKAGMFHEPTYYGGLSTTNGNLARSGNARPYPEIRLATRDYKPVPFLRKLLRFRATYSEGFLNDNRYVDNARLHHKSFYLRTHLSDTWLLDAGIEHFVLWGGTSPEENVGKMPSDIEAYFRYITGTAGDKAFPIYDQQNVAGNQLGTYQISIQKNYPVLKLTFYISHLFEEMSGLKWRNWPDNLLGIHLNFLNEKKWISEMVYEYTNTRQQSIRNTENDPDPGNYFRHGIYRSSFTYHQQMIGSPLFYPLILEDGIVRAVGSNRFHAHHIGFSGSLLQYITWKGMVTYINHLGLYTAPYEKPQEQLSGIIELIYENPKKIPVDIGLSIASDAGKYAVNKTALQVFISTTF